MQEVETRWLQTAIQGDDEAFGKLVEAYQTAVYNLCYRMLGDAYEAEDAAQETFLRAYGALKRYDSSRPFSTWLLSIAAHFCIDQIRRRRMVVLPFESLPYQDIPDQAPNPESVLSTGEDQQRVRSLLRTLNPTDRAIVIMFYWYDFSYDEIAEGLNLTVSAVKSRLHRARLGMARTWMDTPGLIEQKKRNLHGEVRASTV